MNDQSEKSVADLLGDLEFCQDQLATYRWRVRDRDAEIERLRGELVETERGRCEEEELREKLAGLLKRTAIALKGPEPELTMWSWHDLPELAEHLRAALAEVERDAERYRWIRYWNRVDPLRLPEDVSFEHEDDFDAAIDAAMAREEG